MQFISKISYWKIQQYVKGHDCFLRAWMPSTGQCIIKQRRYELMTNLCSSQGTCSILIFLHSPHLTKKWYSFSKIPVIFSCSTISTNSCWSSTKFFWRVTVSRFLCLTILHNSFQKTLYYSTYLFIDSGHLTLLQ